MRNFAWLVLAAGLLSMPAQAKRPQILPEPMLVNLFALSEASAALQVCAASEAFGGLPSEKKALLRRMQGGIDDLVRKIAGKFDEDLFPFFVESRNEAALRPEKIAEMRARFRYCNDAFFDRMKRFVYDSRQKLDFFLSQQPDAR